MNHHPERPKLISIVTPCYNEEDNVEECHRVVARIFAESLPTYDFEHIFCDNASRDGTPATLRRMALEDPRVKVIFNARNFGPFRSTFNGVLATSGDAVVVLLAADLQDPPEIIINFVRKWEEGHQVIYGIRANREEGLLMRIVRKVYYRAVSRFADIHIPPDVGEFQLVDRCVITALRKFDDHYPYIRGMIASCGFRTIGVAYTWKARKRGFSKNRIFHLVDQGLNGLISFTNLPMRMCMLFGFILAGLSIAFACITLIANFIYLGTLAPPGIPTLIVAIFFFSGIQMFFFGILGEYVSAIHFQVRKRPLVTEQARLNFGCEEGPAAVRPDEPGSSIRAPVSPASADGR